MTLGLLLLHLLGFVMPALAMAVFMPWAGRWVLGSDSKNLRSRMGVHALMGVGVLLGGLWLNGQDGKMSTYIALVLVSATVEWGLRRAWKGS